MNLNYNKLFFKNLLILLPKYKENMNSFLAPILGLYGINIQEFIEEFEDKTIFINFDIVIPIKIILYKTKSYEMIIK